jgi:hypothetical protein
MCIIWFLLCWERSGIEGCLLKSVAYGIDIHSGADGGKQQDVARIQMMLRQGCLPDHIEQCGNRGNGTVTQLTYVHGHNTVGYFLAAKQAIKGFHDSHIHFFIGLMNEYFFQLIYIDVTGIQARFHGSGDGPEGKFINFTALHFEIPGIGSGGRAIRLAERNIIAFNQGMRLADRTQDTGLVQPGPAGFEEDGACAIAIEHAVTVVGIDDPAQGLGADDQALPGETRPDIHVRLYESLKPARTAEQQIIGYTGWIADSQQAFYPAGEARYGIGLATVLGNVAKVVRDDQLIDSLWISAGILYGGCGGKSSHVRRIHAVMRIAPLGNSRNLFELIDDLYGIACDALPVVVIKFDKSKISIRSNLIRYIAACPCN